jgi:hypothetical protein
MAKHSGPSDGKAGTDAGPAFQDLSPEDKAKEFDASDSDPLGYAHRNFGAAPEAQQTRQGRQG